MIKNEFFIGLGGVGGRSLQAFRRTFIERKSDSEMMLDNGMLFEYLYIDSNDDILKQSGWEIYGENIRLNPADVIELKEGGITPPLSEIASLPNVSPWIGRLSEHFSARARVSASDSDTQLQGMDGAAQLRRFGRALFARHTAAIRNVLTSKIAMLQNGRDSGINFRIFCTLGGGTGSGCLIDMVTLLRTLGREQGFDARLFVYPFIAGAAGGAASNAGSFYENEYATLRDLNALMVGRYHPYIVGQDKFHNQGNEFVNDPKPVQQVYIASEMAPGSPLLPQQIAYMAKACFDAIVYGSGKSEEANCLKALTGEDLVDVNPGEPAAGAPLRSYRFSAFGARRWCVPTAQIKELLKYDCEKRVLKNWVFGAPFPPGVGCRDYRLIEDVAHDLRNGTVFMSLDSKLQELLSPLKSELESINKHEKRDIGVLQKLREISDVQVHAARALIANNAEFAKFDSHCEREAEVFFKSILDALDKVMTWKTAAPDAWGLQDIRLFLEEYIKGIGEWPRLLLGGLLPDLQRDNDFVCNMKNREMEWKKQGFLTILLTHLDERMIAWQHEDAQNRVSEAFMPFRKKVLEELCVKIATKLNRLKNVVDIAVRDLQGKLNRIDKKIAGFETDLNGSVKGGFGDMYEFDAENLRKVRHAMGEQTPLFCEMMAADYSPLWTEKIGSLDRYKSGNLDTLCHLIDSSLIYETSEKIHNRACTRNNLEQVLIANILERLEQIAGPEEALWDSRLRSRIQNFLKSIGSSITTVGGTGLRHPQTSPAAAIVFGFPKSSIGSALRVWLEQKLKENIPNSYAVMVGRDDVYNHNSDHEIRVLYVPYWFPARFATVVDVIYNRYVDTSQSADGDVKIYFANIDDKDNQLDSKSRPAVTRAGDPDEENAMLVELATEFFVRQGEDKVHIIDQNNDGIKILQQIDAFGMPQYTPEPYPLSMLFMPSLLFKNQLQNALVLAVDSMSREDKLSVIMTYVNRMKKMKTDGVKPTSDEYTRVDNLYRKAQEILHVV